MASVSSNYAEVFIDSGSGAAASQSSEGVVYSEVQVGGTSASSSQQHQSVFSSTQQQQNSSQQQEIVSSSGQGTLSNAGTLESQLAERIVGYGYQSYAIEDESATGQVEKKESKFGQLRRSFGKGKKKRLPTGFAANFANTRDIIMKGWLHKQDSGGFRLWKRRWFVLRANELYYYKSPKDNGALGCVKLTPEQRIAPTDDNISKKYSFKITQEGTKSYILAADNKETLTNWMNAVSLSAQGLAPETITQSLKELQQSATLRRSTSTSNGRSTLRSIAGGGSASTQSTLMRGNQTARVQPASQQVQSTNAFVAPINPPQLVVQSSSVNGPVVNSVAVTSAKAIAGTSAVKPNVDSKSLQSCDISEAEDDEEDDDEDEDEDEEESDEDEEDDDEESELESSVASSGMEQVNFADRKPPPAPSEKDSGDEKEVKRRAMNLQQSANTNFFGNLLAETNITENVNINKTENVNINKTENVNIKQNLDEKININIEGNEGLKSFFGSGQHLTGSTDQTAVKTATIDLVSTPLAVKPPAYNQLNRDAPLSSPSSSGRPPSVVPGPPLVISNGNMETAKVSGRAGQVFGNLSEWQNRTLQRPKSANRHRIASAGDPLAEKQPFDRNRTQSADDYLDAPGNFHRTQSMRSLKMWYEHQRITGRSRGATPEPEPYGRYHNHQQHQQQQQPVIMDLDKNERLTINPATTTLVRSKSRQAHQTLTKSSGALVPVRPQPQRPATAMGGSMALVSRDQVMMQKNYQLQMYLRQQYLAQQQQQQQQQNALMMQQQMQQQQAMMLQQQIQREEELLRKKKEKEKKEKEKMAKQKRERELIEQQQIEEQLKRSTTIINESVSVSNDPKVKRVFVRRAKKETKPPTPPPPPAVEKVEFSMQTITDSGCQTEEIPEPTPPPPVFSETLIVRSPSPGPVKFVETISISPPTPPAESDEESEEEWEVLVSSDQNSWNMVAKETLPARVIRSASLSNLEYFIRDELSAETQKVLEDAEEVRFSEEVIETIMTKTVEDTTTTNTTKTIQMVSETNNNVVDGVYIADVEEGEIVLPAITLGSSSSAVVASGNGDVGTARTTTVTNVTTDPHQDSQVETYSTDEGEGKSMSTRFHQGHATIVDDKVAYDYASSDEAKAEFQRQLLQMRTEFGEAGDVSSDSGMSYQTPAGSNVSVEQKITSSKTGVQVYMGDGNQQMVQQQPSLQQLQAPAISITDMDTNQILPPPGEGYTHAFTEPQLEVSPRETGGVDVSLGDFRIAAIKRRVSTIPDEPMESKEKEISMTQTKAVKGILKKSRPSSSSSEHDVSANQFTEQFMNTVSRLSEGQLTASRMERRSSVCLEDGALPDPVVKSSTIVVQANSPATSRKATASSEAAAVDISLEAPSTKHYSTHLHKTISPASTPTLTLEVDTSAEKKPTTVLTTTLDTNRASQEISTQSISVSGNQSAQGSITAGKVDSSIVKTPTTLLTTTLDTDPVNGSPFVVESRQISTQNISVAGNQSAQGSIQLGQLVQCPESGSVEAQFVADQSHENTEAQLERIMSELNERKATEAERNLIGAELPPLDQDLEKVREKFVSSVSKGRQSTESSGALGRKLIAVKRETEAKQTTLTYFTRRLKEEEEVLEVIAHGGNAPYVEGRKQTQTKNVEQLREKVAGIEKGIEEGKAKIAALEIEWNKVKPEGDVDLLASLSRSTSTSRSELRGGVSNENILAAGTVSGGAGGDASGSLDVNGGGGSVVVAGVDANSGANGFAGGSASSSVRVGGSSSSVSIDTMESKAVAVEKEAMRSVLSTISSQFTARNQDFDKLRREEEEIKALLASRMRGIDLEIDQIEAEQQRLEIEQTLEDLEADNITVEGATQRAET